MTYTFIPVDRNGHEIENLIETFEADDDKKAKKAAEKLFKKAKRKDDSAYSFSFEVVN
jgi:hypothetical protein